MNSEVQNNILLCDTMCYNYLLVDYGKNCHWMFTYKWLYKNSYNIYHLGGNMTKKLKKGNFGVKGEMKGNN